MLSPAMQDSLGAASVKDVEFGGEPTSLCLDVFFPEDGFQHRLELYKPSHAVANVVVDLALDQFADFVPMLPRWSICHPKRSACSVGENFKSCAIANPDCHQLVVSLPIHVEILRTQIELRTVPERRNRCGRVIDGRGFGSYLGFGWSNQVPGNHQTLPGCLECLAFPAVARSNCAKFVLPGFGSVRSP